MKKIPLSSPDIGPKEIELVHQVLKTPYVSMGPMVPHFEKVVERYVGVKHAVAVSSGTSGLHLAVIAAGIKEGDEVITTPFSFVASANCILYERGVPVFVDIESDTFNIDVERIEEKITPRTKAILAVHVFGRSCQMDRIMEIGKRHKLMVIEDACEAIGAKFNGKQVGTFGDCGIYAFYANKQITTGEGGVLVTNRNDWAKLFRSLRNQGRDDHGVWMRHVRLGYNYRLGELSAALGIAQIERIEELLDKREKVAGWYNERLVDMKFVEMPYISPETTRMSWFVYVICIKPPAHRDHVMGQLEKVGILSRPYFTPIHLQPFYQESFGYKKGDFPVSEFIGGVSLALPFSGVMTEAQVDHVCRTLRKILQK